MQTLLYRSAVAVADRDLGICSTAVAVADSRTAVAESAQISAAKVFTDSAESAEEYNATGSKSITSIPSFDPPKSRASLCVQHSSFPKAYPPRSPSGMLDLIEC